MKPNPASAGIIGCFTHQTWSRFQSLITWKLTLWLALDWPGFLTRFETQRKLGTFPGNSRMQADVIRLQEAPNVRARDGANADFIDKVLKMMFWFWLVPGERRSDYINDEFLWRTIIVTKAFLFRLNNNENRDIFSPEKKKKHHPLWILSAAFGWRRRVWRAPTSPSVLERAPPDRPRQQQRLICPVSPQEMWGSACPARETYKSHWSAEIIRPCRHVPGETRGKNQDEPSEQKVKVKPTFPFVSVQRNQRLCCCELGQISLVSMLSAPLMRFMGSNGIGGGSESQSD